MLDIPTPPIARPVPDGVAAVPTTDTTADLLVSSDEESGGWKLISRDVPKSIGRRRTTTERSAGESSLQAFAAARTPSKVPARARKVGSYAAATRADLHPRPRLRSTITTTTEKGHHGHHHEALSPVVESPPSRSDSVVTVTRSRTLPSSKTGRRAEPGEERPSKLVKKQKRASVQPGRTVSGGGGGGANGG